MRILAATMLLFVPACSAFEPETGPFQGTREAGAASSGGYGTGAGDAARTTGPDPRCAPDGGFVDDDCDLCENASCCGERFACIDDPGFNGAVEAFESCPADAGVRAPSCWNDLAASGALAKALVTCVSTKCKAQCATP